MTVLYDDCDFLQPLVKVEFWEQDFDGSIKVSEGLAAALLSADGQRQLAFLSDADANGLRCLAMSEYVQHHENAMAALGKIIALLDKRDEIPF